MEHIINPQYLKKESIEQLQKTWNKPTTFTHILLTRIFTPEAYKEKKRQLQELKFHRNTRPDSHSYASVKSSNLHILDNKEFLQFISQITGKEVKKISGEAYYFSWKDYILLSKRLEKKGTDILLDFTKNWQEEWGGATIYKDSKGKYLKLIPSQNTLMILERKNIQRYFQYVNNLAKGEKRYVILGKID